MKEAGLYNDMFRRFKQKGHNLTLGPFCLFAILSPIDNGFPRQTVIVHLTNIY